MAANPLMNMLTQLMMQKSLQSRTGGGMNPPRTLPMPGNPGVGIGNPNLPSPRPPMPGPFAPRQLPKQAPPNFAALAAQLMNNRRAPRGPVIPRPPVM